MRAYCLKKTGEGEKKAVLQDERFTRSSGSSDPSGSASFDLRNLEWSS